MVLDRESMRSMTCTICSPLNSDHGVVMTVALGFSCESMALAVTTLPSEAESVRLKTMTSACCT